MICFSPTVHALACSAVQWQRAAPDPSAHLKLNADARGPGHPVTNARQNPLYITHLRQAARTSCTAILPPHCDGCGSCSGRLPLL